MRFVTANSRSLINFMLILIVCLPSGALVARFVSSGNQLNITEVAQSIASILALGFIAFQLLETKRLEKAKLILQLNEGLVGFREIAQKYDAIDNLGDFQSLSSDEKEALLDNISYFESIFHMHKSGILSIDEIDDYFGGRIMRLYNNKVLQTVIFKNIAEFGDTLNPFIELCTLLLNKRSV